MLTSTHRGTMSTEEYLRRIQAGRIQRNKPLQRKTPLRQPSQDYYNGRRGGTSDIRAKPVHDMATGLSFDSTSEYKRYCTLALMEKAGEIRDLKVHVYYTLIPAAGKAPEIGFTVDYTYHLRTGQFIIEDHKPRPPTPRENLIFKLWKHYGPSTLSITNEKGQTTKLIPGRQTE